MQDNLHNNSEIIQEAVDRIIKDVDQLADQGLQPDEIEEYVAPRVAALKEKFGDEFMSAFIKGVFEYFDRTRDFLRDAGFDI